MSHEDRVRVALVHEAAKAVGRTKVPFAWGTLNDAAQAECIEAASAAVSVVRPLLLDFDTWTAVADAIGHHPHSYDLSDESHRLDVVQIVCEQLAKLVDR